MSGWRACIDHIIRPDSPCPVCEIERLSAECSNLKLANEEARKTIDRLSALVPRKATDPASAGQCSAGEGNLITGEQ